MDVYIRQELLLNANSSLDEVSPHCLKLLAWLQECQAEIHLQNGQILLTHGLVESMVKASLYLYECRARFGEALVARCEDHSFYTNSSTLEERQQRIRELCATIVNTQQGEKHAVSLYWMHKALTEAQPGWSILKDLDWASLRSGNAATLSSELNTSLWQMRCLVRRICRLATAQQMEMALQRSLEHIGFEVWLHLFSEPHGSTLHSHCYLLRHMICDMLMEKDESTAACSAFVHHVYLFVASSLNELRFWRCLEHGRLAAGLTSYVTNYWSRHLPHVDLDDMQLLSASPLPLEEVLYLTHIMLAPKSPCRQTFHQQLSSLALAQHLQDLLNKVAYVYS